MKQSGRRSIFKKGKGGAFLRFLIGEMLLIALAGVVYLFILQGNIPLSSLPGSSSAVSASPASDEATATPVPTEVPTIASSATPVPTPAVTPIPLSELSMPAGEEAPDLPEVLDDSLKLGMNEFRAFTDAGQSVLIVGGYAFIEGLDAAKSTVYLVVFDADSGLVTGMYPTTPTPENANLSFSESSGDNLASAFFTINLDVSEYPDTSYMLSVMVVNEEKVAFNFFDNRTFHFIIEDGVLSVVE